MKHIYNQIIICLLMFGGLSVNAQTFQQTNRIAGVGSDQLQDVATDASDNFYGLGYFTNQITDPVTITTSATITKTFLLKYDPTGAVTWNKGIYSSGSGSVKSYRVAVDNSGNVFIAGSLYGSSIFFNGFAGASTLNGPNVLAPDGFIAKYSSTGAFLWVRAIGSNANNDEIFDMALDGNGDVYVTGYISADANVYGKDNGGTQATTDLITSQGGTAGLLDVLVAKFANDGTFQWGYSVGSTTGAEKGTAIATDASNNVYVGGVFFNTVNFDPTAAASTSTLTEVAPQGSGDAFIAKYSTGGGYVNVGQISGVGTELVNRMHVGASGKLNVAGSFTGLIDADLRSASTQNLTAAGSSGKDILFARYDLSTFAPTFAKQIGAANLDDEAIGIKSNSSGDVYLTGYFSGATVNFNPAGTALNLTSVGGKDVFIAKYNSSGVNTWGFSAGSATDDQGSNMDFNSSAFVYAGGIYTGSISDFNPGSGTSSLTDLGMEDSYWSKYQECSSMPVIGSQPSGQTICAGASINLSIGVTGSGIIYKWQKGGVDVVDGGTISGSTTPALSITSSVAANAGTYRCIVSSCGNNLTSNNAVMVVNVPPSIITQPTATSACSTGTATFSVAATGTSLTYQWKLNGNPITNNAIYAGAQAATLNLVSPTSAEAGTYTCVITGSCAPVVTTNGATLTVGSGITITSNPVGTPVCMGGNATFTVSATGSPLSYQWQKGGVTISDGGTVSGATTASLVITGVVASDASNYKCVITGSCGTATSTAAILSITSAPAITGQPNPSQTICSGQSATFSITATGAVSYQWKKNGVDLSNTGNVSGALTANLLLTSITSADAATYTCQVTGSCSPTVISNNAMLSVNTLPSISGTLTGKTICSGASVNFNILATGSGTTYQWQKNGVNVTNSGSISGATTNSLTITGATTADAGNYTCVVSGTCSPFVTSSTAVLTVNSTASIVSDPSASTVCAGQSATFTLGTTGSGITYQWKKGGVNLSNGGNIIGALTSVLTIAGTTSANAGTYSCEINNTCSGILTSLSATLTVNSLPTIIIQPKDSTICGSAPVSFSVTATGTGITYQWKKGSAALVDGGTISGSTNATLMITPAVTADAGAYTCVVSGVCTPAVVSSVANLAVGSVAIIVTPPSNVTVCSGSTATMSIVVSGTGISYQWQKNGVDLVNGSHVSGATTNSLSILNATSADADTYTCKAGNTCSGFLTSSAATITVNDLPAITIQSGNKSICAGSSVTFSITATGTGISYQWKKDGVVLTDGGVISGSQTASLSLSSTTTADAGTYTCEVSGTCSPKAVSSGAVLTVSASGAIITQPTSQSVCTGTTAVLVCNAAGGTVTYQWKKDGVVMSDGANVSGSTTSTLTITNVTVADVASYVCEATTSCSGLLTSNAANLTVNNSTTIYFQPASLTKCIGDVADFSITATGSGITYQWTKGGSNIAGATNSLYSIPAVASADAGSYICNITGACSFVASSAAMLTVNAPISVVSQPVDMSACPNDVITLTITVTGNVSSYQWKKDGVALVDGGNISNSSTNALTVSAFAAADAGAYTCDLIAVCGSNVTSATANVTMSTAPTIVTQPNNTLVCIGQVLNLSITVSNPSNTLYQWKKDGVTLVDGGTVSGSTSSILTILSATTSTSGNYVCEVSTVCSSANVSNVAAVSTTNSASITLQPITASVCKGQPVYFVTNIAGNGITYQWQYKLNSSNVYTNVVNIPNKISGATSNSLAVLNADVLDEGSYKCVITENCGAIQNSAPAGLIVTSPNIIQNPFAQSVCTGQFVKFNIVATGDKLSYQWYKDGIKIVNGGNVAGATTASLSIASTTSADNGDYTCTVTGVCPPPATSLPATLTVSVCTAISLADTDGAKLIAYPIPANENLTLEIKDRTGAEVNLVLFDPRGVSVFQMNTTLGSDNEKININTTDLSQGMYYMQIQFGDGFYSDKVEVIH